MYHRDTWEAVLSRDLAELSCKLCPRKWQHDDSSRSVQGNKMCSVRIGVTVFNATKRMAIKFKSRIRRSLQVRHIKFETCSCHFIFLCFVSLLTACLAYRPLCETALKVGTSTKQNLTFLLLLFYVDWSRNECRKANKVRIIVHRTQNRGKS
jgi:hypothetical protein